MLPSIDFKTIFLSGVFLLIGFLALINIGQTLLFQFNISMGLNSTQWQQIYNEYQAKVKEVEILANQTLLEQQLPSMGLTDQILYSIFGYQGLFLKKQIELQFTLYGLTVKAWMLAFNNLVSSGILPSPVIWAFLTAFIGYIILTMFKI